MRGKSIVITGAFGSLGTATARAAIQLGASITMLGRATQVPAELAKEFGQSAFILSGVELADDAAATTAMNAAQRAMRGIDVLINTAGTFKWQNVADGDPQAWDALFKSNLKSTVNSCKAAIPHLRRSEGGRIINVGAFAALQAGPGMGAYAASKSGVHRLTESLAAELKADRITVNAVLPSVIDTPANRADMPKADFSSWVSTGSLAHIVLFLASDQAQAITGALLPVVGGM
jgi:NAD(P)-dependent dehydrogenase (short-subunit alcohol dehydrogenase family)